MSVKVSIDKKAKTVTITLPLEKPTKSKSGKNMVIASTRGNQKTETEYDDCPVTVGVNCFYKPAEESDDDEE